MRISWRFGMGRVESVNDYAGVLIPLEEAHLHSHSARTGRTEFEPRDDSAATSGEEGGDSDDDAGSAKDGEGDGERQGMLEMEAAEYTIEGLRKEMRLGRKGQWTDYESESTRKLRIRKLAHHLEQSNQNSSTRPYRI